MDVLKTTQAQSIKSITELIWITVVVSNLVLLTVLNLLENQRGSALHFLLISTILSGVNTNLGVERHQRGVKPQPPTNRALLVEDDIVFVGNCITPVHTVRDSGVMLDSKMIMSQNVMRVCQNCYF